MLLLGVAGLSAQTASVPDALENAERQRREAVAAVESAATALVEAGAWRAERARARLRLAERADEAALAATLRRRELAAAFAARAHDRDNHARLVLASLARTAAAAAALDLRLRGEAAALARQQRAATGAFRLRQARLAAAQAMMEAAGERWRRTLRARIAVLAEAPSAGPIRSTGRARSAGPPSATGPDHKRAIAPDLKLDRKLLRLAASDASRPAEPRRLEPAAVLPTRFWPIAGEPLVLGPRELTIATAIDQVVSSPVSGRVVFAEPFRGLGPLLIIDLGRGYHAVLAGLARLDVRRGASVVAGQSLGEIVPRTDGPARLQLELRHRGLPIDPMPWLVAYHDKVRS